MNIYSAQIVVARLLGFPCVAELANMLEHEQRHRALFTSLMARRGVRPCYAIQLWSLGGFVLGTLTAVLGQRAIWSCTVAIESTVNAHLFEQRAQLRGLDDEVLKAVESIVRDEQEHEERARARRGDENFGQRVLRAFVAGATGGAIWLSTKL